MRVVVGFDPARGRSIQRSFTVHGDAVMVGTRKAVLRGAGDRPLLGTFLNDPLGVLAGLVGYARGNWASRMLFTGLEGGS